MPATEPFAVSQLLADPSFHERFAAALGSSTNFVRQTRWYDGRVLLEIGPACCWLKIYRGRIVETLAEVPPLGYTVKLSGPLDAWQAYFSGERSFDFLTTPGRRVFDDGRPVELTDGFDPPAISIEGDGMEAMRMYEGLFALVETLRDLLREVA